jgi:hypothetical protein
MHPNHRFNRNRMAEEMADKLHQIQTSVMPRYSARNVAAATLDTARRLSPEGWRQLARKTGRYRKPDPETCALVIRKLADRCPVKAAS